MTEDELKRFRFYAAEERQLVKEINELQQGYRDEWDEVWPVLITDIDDPELREYTEHFVALSSAIHQARFRALRQRLKIEQWLATVNDAELRTAVRMKYVEGKTWERIGQELHLDGSWVRRRVKELLDSPHNPPEKPDL